MLQILVNTAGAYAKDLVQSGTSTATGYSQTDLISGPRSKYFRSSSATGGTLGYICDPSSVACTHLVIARADWLLTLNAGPNYGTEIQAYRYAGYDATSASSVTSAIILDESTDLIGYNYQDYVTSWNSASGYGWAINQYGNPSTATTHVFQCSKLYFSNAYDFGVNPRHQGINWEYFDQGRLNMFRTLEGTFDYACEARITIQFPEIESTYIDQFLALPEIYRWPFFLYDSAGDVIPWKIEHVILERIEQQILADDVWQVSLSFLRLKHYP